MPPSAEDLLRQAQALNVSTDEIKAATALRVKAREAMEGVLVRALTAVEAMIIRAALSELGNLNEAWRK